MSETLVRNASSLLARATSRRGFLVRVAGVGSAIAIGPIRFLLYPDSASALCSSGKCADGYHEFCCSVVGYNDCPSYTYHGGWWKCSSYTGSGLCAGRNQRYYIDCHIKKFMWYSCDCKCARGTCNCRRTCCNTFHYGNCHSERRNAPEEIVCRKVVCDNPCALYPNACSCQGAIANQTCGHHACTGCV